MNTNIGEPSNRDYQRNKRDAMASRVNDIAASRAQRGVSGETSNSAYGYARSRPDSRSGASFASSRDQPVV
jgi:hypothetical protein